MAKSHSIGPRACERTKVPTQDKSVQEKKQTIAADAQLTAEPAEEKKEPPSRLVDKMTQDARKHLSERGETPVETNDLTGRGLAARMLVDRYREVARGIAERADFIEAYGGGVSSECLADALFLLEIYRIWDAEGYRGLLSIIMDELQLSGMKAVTA